MFYKIDLVIKNCIIFSLFLEYFIGFWSITDSRKLHENAKMPNSMWGNT
jgi:hypothetical protein